MDDVTFSGDWIAGMRDGFFSELNSLRESGDLSQEEFSWLTKSLLETNGRPTVHRLLIGEVGEPLADLAGYFVVTSGTGTMRTFMYSPVVGLEAFATEFELSHALEQRLGNPLLREDVLRFSPIEDRPSLASVGPLNIKYEPVYGDAFVERAQSVLDLRSHNLEGLTQRLIKFASLRQVLNDGLKVQLDLDFQGLDLSPMSTVVNSYEKLSPAIAAAIVATTAVVVPADLFVPQVVSVASVAPSLVSSMSLSDAALLYYANDGWSQEHIRDYHSLSVPVDDRSKKLDERMQALVRRVTQGLEAQMKAITAAFWSYSFNGLSAREWSVQVVGDRFFNELLRARHQGVISREQFASFKVSYALDQASPSYWPSSWKPGKLSLTGSGNVLIEFAGLFNAYLPGHNGEVFLCCNSGGMERFAHRSVLTGALWSRLKQSGHEKSLRAHVSLDQQAIFRVIKNGRLDVEVNVLEHNLFESVVQSIVDKQSRDLTYLLTWAREQGSNLSAVVDHAFDVRELLDPQLLTLGTQGRWSTRLVLDPLLAAAPAADQLMGLGEARLLQGKLPSLDTRIRQALQPMPTLRTFAQERLASELAVLGKGHLQPQHLMVQTFVSNALTGKPQLQTSRSLVDRLLERLTGCDVLSADTSSLVLRTEGNSPELKWVDGLVTGTLLSLLDRVAQGFAREFNQRLRAFYAVAQGTQGTPLAQRLAQLRSTALRYEYHLKALDTSFSRSDGLILKTLLDQPQREQRSAIKGFIPDVCEVLLSLEGQPLSLALSQCTVMTERGGTDSENSGRAILWTVEGGFECFNGIDDCLASLLVRLQDKTRQWALLECIDRREHPQVLDYLQGKSAGAVRFVLSPVAGHWLEHCQNVVIEKHLREVEFALEHAVRQHLCAESTVHWVQPFLAVEQVVLNVDASVERLNSWLFSQLLADWLQQASVDDQHEYAHVLLQAHQTQGDGDSYLKGVPELLVFAREQLEARLETDFPGLELKADQIEISVLQFVGPAGGEIAGRPAVSRLSNTLTSFAVSNFFNVESGIPSYRSLTGQHLPPGLDDRYVRAMFRSLNISARYQALLEEQLSPGKPGVEERQRLFSQQLPAQVLVQAIEAKLKGELSDTAYGYLKHVFGSPDGKARERLNGTALVIRPLALLALAGRHADVAQGLYLIGPVEAGAGPQILYALYSQDHMFTEYKDEPALLAQLRSSETLQAQVLERLEQQVRDIYRHGGFAEPHIGYTDPTLMSPQEPNPPVTLVTQAITGNMLHKLYHDTVQLRLKQAQAHSKTVAQADWASLMYLLSLITDIALLILPGKLSLPLAVWQSGQFLEHSIESGAEGEWGKAVYEFAMSLLLLNVGLGVAKPEAELINAQEDPFLEPGTPDTAQPPATVRLTLEQQRGLFPFEVNHLALEDLLEDPLTGIFGDSLTGFKYVPLIGKVFRLVAWDHRWRIYIGDDLDGPLVRRNAWQHWELDLQEPLPGGGPVQSRLAARRFERSVNITASGMRTIERLHPLEALQIREAHELAISYLSDCQAYLQSVSSARELSVSTHAYLQVFFSIQAVSEQLLNTLRQMTEALLNVMLREDYSPLTSKKYVMCHYPNDQVIAFVPRLATRKPIYLNSRFFEDKRAYLRPAIRPPAGKIFDSDQHMRAIALVHEFTHIALNTLDINYMGSTYPFLDILVGSYARAGETRSMLEMIRDGQLTTAILQAQLFTELNVIDGTRTAISPELETRLLNRTGTRTLAEVQKLFFDDSDARTNIILMNADSVAILLPWLGYFKPVL